jgi:adenine-specific DNA-methyltransferase
MSNKKKIGSFYTPKNLADFMVNYCLSKIQQQTINVLEPSVGDGMFISSINDCNLSDGFEQINLTIVEREKEELTKANNRFIPENVNIVSNCADYLDFQIIDENRYNLIIGNPPYVKKNYLSDEQKELCKNLHVSSGLSNKSIHNIWTSFLVSAVNKLDNNGILAFVLPLELLQVTFAEEIREFLKTYLDRVEVFTFNELQFQECKGQDTVILFGFKEHNENGVYYTTIDTIEDLNNNNFTLYQNISVSNSNKKWSHHFITPDENAFLENLKKDLNLVSNYVENKPGIVTACNDYFIVNKETLKEFELEKYAKPIVQKGLFVNGSVVFNSVDYQELIDSNKPSYLLDFNNKVNGKSSNKLKEYLNIGVEEEIPLRYKCKKRKNWYEIPNINEESEGFFFKRAHEYPKLIKNEAKVHVTDSAYKLEMNEGYSLNSFIYSFYNSLTLAFAELEGRYYGGGVLELTPNEFRVLPIPYLKIDDFESYKDVFKDKKSISEIVRKYNFEILNSTLGISKEDAQKVENIRLKLINKRFRN